MTLNCLSQLEG
jgi:hypothetical protein